MRKIIPIVLASAIFAGGILLGVRLGANSRSKTEAVVYLPLLVRVHQSLESGQVRAAEESTEMMIIAQLNHLSAVRHTLLFNLAYGQKLDKDELFQKHFAEALSIRKSAATNFFSVGSNGTNGIISQPATH